MFASTPTLSAPENRKGDYRYDYDVPNWETLPAAERKREQARMETYAAMVDWMDRGIRRVLAALNEAGVADNTVVMFLSDNGGCATWPNQRKGQALKPKLARESPRATRRPVVTAWLQSRSDRSE